MKSKIILAMGDIYESVKNGPPSAGYYLFFNNLTEVGEIYFVFFLYFVTDNCYFSISLIPVEVDRLLARKPPSTCFSFILSKSPT